MANEKITSGSGLRKAVFYLTDTVGYPNGDQADEDGYNGVNIEGIKTISINVPDNQRIQHVGDDQTFAQDFLPPSELPSGEFTTAKANQILDAYITGTEVQTIGDMSMDGMDTSAAGFEPDGILMYYRQALVTKAGDAAFGSRRWQTFILPRLRITPKGNSPAQGGDDENAYSMTPTKVLQTPWGIAFTEVDNGFLGAVRLRITSENPIIMERWTGDNTITTFNTVNTPISTAKTKVWVNGVAATVSSVNVGSKTFTLSAAPSAAAKVVALYETTDKIS